MMSIKSIVSEYLMAFPEEHTRLAQLLDLIEHSSNDENLTSRGNFVGHITVSGLVVSRATSKILLVRYKNLRNYLQPGGHLKPNDISLFEAAQRKVVEKTPVR